MKKGKKSMMQRQQKAVAKHKQRTKNIIIGSYVRWNGMLPGQMKMSTAKFGHSDPYKKKRAMELIAQNRDWLFGTPYIWDVTMIQKFEGTKEDVPHFFTSEVPCTVEEMNETTLENAKDLMKEEGFKEFTYIIEAVA